MEEQTKAYETFSGMHTERENEEEDELIQELPIYLTQQLAQQLLVIQQTLRYSAQIHIANANVIYILYNCSTFISSLFSCLCLCCCFCF